MKQTQKNNFTATDTTGSGNNCLLPAADSHCELQNYQQHDIKFGVVAG
jgi:hypothetical protein